MPIFDGNAQRLQCSYIRRTHACYVRVGDNCENDNYTAFSTRRFCKAGGVPAEPFMGRISGRKGLLDGQEFFEINPGDYLLEGLITSGEPFVRIWMMQSSVADLNDDEDGEGARALLMKCLHPYMQSYGFDIESAQKFLQEREDLAFLRPALQAVIETLATATK